MPSPPTTATCKGQASGAGRIWIILPLVFRQGFKKRSITRSRRGDRFPRCRRLKFQGALALAIDNSTLGQVVRREFDFHSIARDDSDKVLAHFAGHMRQDLRSVIHLHAEPRVRQRLSYRSLNF